MTWTAAKALARRKVTSGSLIVVFIVPFPEVAVTVPVELETSEFGVGVSLIWRL